MGRTVGELQAAMTDLEFRRHCQDQQDYPDAIERMASLMFTNTLLLNMAVGSLTKDGKPPFTINQIAPWAAKGEEPKPQEMDMNTLASLTRHMGESQFKLK
jgi:hypothetical protein